MKKIILATISVAFFMFLTLNKVEAQKANVRNAQKWAESGEQLNTALNAIKLAEAHEDTKDWAKTYYVKGLIYDAIANTDNPVFQNICENPMVLAFDSYKKAYDMSGSESYHSDMDLKFFSLANSFIQKAIETFNAGDFENSFVYFAKSIEIKEMSVFKGEVDTAVNFNTAMAAQRIKKYDEAIMYYNKLVEYGYGAGDTYALLASCYKDKGDNKKYINTLKDGYLFYPGNADLLGGIINYYLLESDNSEEAIKYLNVAKQKDPYNAQYYLAEAQLYTKIGRQDKAKELYLKSIKLSPDLFEAHYNLGVIYFNEAVVLSDEANNITDDTKWQVAKEIADAKFAEALPFIENAHRLSQKDMGIMSTLKTLYYRLRMTDKYEEISKKME